MTSKRGFQLATTLLYCPASRPERFAKGVLASPQIIVDLEDSVPAEVKDSARGAVRAAFEVGVLTTSNALVRINGFGTPWHARDVAMVRGVGARLVLPKAETVDAISSLDGLDVVAICETPLGVLNAQAIAAHPSVIAINWGGEDLTASLGGRSSRRSDGSYLPLVEYVRPHVLLACGASGKVAIDGAYVALGDDDGLFAEATEGAAMGFGSKIALHPNQIETIRRAYRASDEQREWATSLLMEAASKPSGAFAFRGRMVDAPLLNQARALLREEGAL